jgi:hypothetical protein
MKSRQYDRQLAVSALLAVVILGFPVAPVRSQAPVEDLTSREQAVQRGQLKAGAAYRAVQEAQYEAKLAEQDVLNAREVHQAAQQHADEMKRRLDAATRALAAAREKEAKARKDYEAALADVDKAFQKPPR